MNLNDIFNFLNFYINKFTGSWYTVEELENVLDFAKLAVEFHAGALLQHMVRFIKVYAKPDKGNFTNQQREELAQIAKSILDVPIEMPQVDPYTPNVFNLKALKDDFVPILFIASWIFYFGILSQFTYVKANGACLGKASIIKKIVVSIVETLRVLGYIKCIQLA